MAGEDSLLVRMAVDTGQLKQQLDQAQGAISGWSNSVKGALGGLMAGVSIGAAAAYFTSITKGALEAADSMGDLSAAVGVPVETLSKFSLAAQTSGASLEMLGKGLKQLGITMVDSVRDPAADSAKAFETLGVEVKDTTTGALRPTEDVLLDLAESFSQMEDGAMRTALAADIFGKKIGPELIPFLKNGKEGLQELADTAEALGLTLDQKTVSAADRTNDMLTVLGQVSAGLGNKILREVLPTLEGLASQFLETAKTSGALDTAAESVATAFKLIVSVGIAAFNALQAIGGAIGGIVAAIVQALSGDFRGALNTVRAVADDTGKRVVTTGEQIGAVWDESLGRVDGKAVALAKSLNVVDKNSKAAKKSADDYAKAAQTVAELTAKSLGVNTDYVAKLQALELWYSRNRDRTDEYRAAVIELIGQQESSKNIVKKQEEAEKALAKAMDDANKEREKSLETYQKETEKITEQVAKLQQETAQLGLTKQAQAALTAEMRIAEIVRLEALAQSDMVLLAGQDEVDSINARIAALKGLNEAEGNLAAKGAMVEAAKKTSSEWEKTAGQIEQALTDALVQGFTSGKSIVKSVGDWIKNYFLTNIARSIAQSITGALTSGFSSIASAAGIGGGGGSGGGEAGGGFGNLLSMGSSLFSSLGSYAMTGLDFVLGGGSVATALGSAGSLMTGGMALEGLATGIGAAAPYALPIIAGVYALSKLFGDKSSPAVQNASWLNQAGQSAGDNPWPTPNLQGDLDTVLQPIIGSIADIVGRLGGTVADVNYGLFTSASPDGKGAQVVAQAWGGSGRLMYTDENVSNAEMQQTLAEKLPKLLLAGLQEADLPEEFAKIFDAIDVNTATGTVIEAAIAKALELKGEQEGTDELPIETVSELQSFVEQSTAAQESMLKTLDEINTKAGTATDTATAGYSTLADLLTRIENLVQRIESRVPVADTSSGDSNALLTVSGAG